MIAIDQSNSLGMSELMVTVTHDSIVATSGMLIMGERRATRFKKALTGSEIEKLNQSLSKIDVRKLKERYHSSVVDDADEFEFTFNINNETKRTKIYGVRHTRIFNLVGEINKMVPEEFKIYYDDDYLRVFEANGG